MDAEKLGNSKILNLFFKPSGMVMESRLRRWLLPPMRTLRGADIRQGQNILEVGSGSGFFTLLAADMVGESGHLIAMEPLAVFAERIAEKVRDAELGNVEVLRRDALNTRLKTGSMDKVLLFGVLPFPTLPLGRLLPEMHRVLRPDGTMAVWMYPMSWGVPGAISRSGLFTKLGKKNGVHAFKRSEGPA